MKTPMVLKAEITLDPFLAEVIEFMCTNAYQLDDDTQLELADIAARHLEAQK